MSPKEVIKKYPTLDREIAALARVSPGTWALVVTLIATLTGWGWSSLANSEEIERHAVVIEQKADKEDVNRRFDEVIHYLKELREDLREERRLHHGSPNRPHTEPHR